MGHEPRVALLSYSTFGNPLAEDTDRVRQVVAMLGARNVGFECDGEMTPDVALDPELLQHYLFCRLSGPANVLVMPGLRSASIAAKLLVKLGGATAIGPLLLGLSHAVQIVPMEATVTDIVNMAVMGCYHVVKA